MNIIFKQSGVGEYIICIVNSMRILIDSGFGGTYDHFIKPSINTINKVDLWILTHTDEDHIGGIVRMIKKGEEEILSNHVNEIWFNYSSIELPPQDDLISVKQGMLLRDKLYELDLLPPYEITTGLDTIVIKDVQIYILSPNEESLEKSKVKWARKEESQIASRSDYHLTIESLLDKEFIEDTSVWNGGSIAILMTHEGKRVMFLADAHPSIIAESLRQEPFNCTPDNPLEVDCIKVSHHGSKANTSYELLELIECADWVFCADGSRHGFPHKECMVKIINHYKDSDRTTRLILNHDTPTYEHVFGVDMDAKDKYNFVFVHLEDGKYEV